MKTAIAKLRSVSPYSQSRFHDTPKKENEPNEAYRARTWRNHLHTDDAGQVIIPPMTFKNCVTEAAKFISMSVPGKGKATFTKYFEAGVMVIDPAFVEPDSVMLFPPANSTRPVTEPVSPEVLPPEMPADIPAPPAFPTIVSEAEPPFALCESPMLELPSGPQPVSAPLGGGRVFWEYPGDDQRGFSLLLGHRSLDLAPHSLPLVRGYLRGSGIACQVLSFLVCFCWGFLFRTERLLSSESNLGLVELPLFSASKAAMAQAVQTVKMQQSGRGQVPHSQDLSLWVARTETRRPQQGGGCFRFFKGVRCCSRAGGGRRV